MELQAIGHLILYFEVLNKLAQIREAANMHQ